MMIMAVSVAAVSVITTHYFTDVRPLDKSSNKIPENELEYASKNKSTTRDF